MKFAGQWGHWNDSSDADDANEFSCVFRVCRLRLSSRLNEAVQILQTNLAEL